jgi:L-threonylcarbamoyladenylate synthase
MVDVILDAGSTPVGIESTVLDLQTSPATILRPGGTTREQLEAVIGRVRDAAASEGPAASPGRQARHYAPRAQIELVAGTTPTEIAGAMASRAHRLVAAGKAVGVLAASEVCAKLAGTPATCFELGALQDLLGIARRLFLGMRTLEARPVDVILSHFMPAEGLGLAINDA